ncbi:MAG: chromo domain-containing protein [Candidatus Thiodiazotropha endolucinida]|nr:chromo domain-containing protein [Candidatus Thiodiazotropha taylori]MCW4346076.1 chromo domain-containing protein [Candidatus Thiodiazotropha endolucinida]
MKKDGVIYFPTQNETKASTSERAILTIKTRLNRYFTYMDDYTYLPVLQKIADSYNKTYHRTIGTTPAEVNPTNEEEIRISTYLAHNSGKSKIVPKKRPFKYRLNQHVRVSHLKGAFTRAYDQTYSGEIFQISKRYYRGSLPIYRLKDLQGDEIKGTWYESELLPLEIDPDKMSFKIDKILKRRGKGKNQEVFVSWKHYPKKFNQWIKKTDIE